MVRLGQSTRERSKLGLLFGMTSHSNEQYGYMAVYMRLEGIVSALERIAIAIRCFSLTA